MSYKHDVVIYDPEYDTWAPTGVEGYYVSTQGMVIGPGRHGEPEFLRPQRANKHGHLEVYLYTNGRRTRKYVHRLVAEAFIPNPHHYPLVRHLDDDPTNNSVDNLAWGTQTDNMHDCVDSGRFRYLSDDDRELAMEKRRTPIVAINIKTGDKLNFISQQEAARVLNVSQSSICRVLEKKSSNAKGYYFINKDEELDIDLSRYKYHRKKALIRAVHVATGRSYIYNGQTQAAVDLGMSVSAVCMVLSGKMTKAKGYYFEYVDEEELYD